MAPAITHFLVGASLLLLTAGSFILRYDLDRTAVMWLVPIGGVWGLAPDFHHIAPVFAAELHALHGSSWMSLFAFHYVLDTPAVRGRSNESIFFAIILFLLALSVVSVAYRLRDRRSIARTRIGRMAVTGLAGVIAAGSGTIALTAVVSTQWAFDTVAGLVGTDRVLVGVVVVFVGGFVVGLGYFTAFVLVVPRQYQAMPLSGAGIGVGLGVVAWLGGVVVFVPLWVQWMVGGELAIPFVHWLSLGGLVLYGAVFGGMYAIVSGAFAVGSGREIDGEIVGV